MSRPDNRYLEGLQALTNGDYANAEDCLREVVRATPDHADAVANLGYVLDQRGQIDEGEHFLRQAIRLAPTCAEAFLNLGALLTKAARYTDAEAICLQAVSLAPQTPQSWSNLGVLYARFKREAEAEQCFRTAMGINSEHAASQFNLSYLLLRQGFYEEGWQRMEARRWYATFEGKLSCPRWQGESVHGKSVLMTYEAGHGDMIQFVRYARILREKGARQVDLICHPALKTLLSAQESLFDHVHAFNETFSHGDWDCWTPPLSLPYHCKTRIESIPAEIPYLHASEEKIANWKPRLPQGCLRTGLVWKGSTGFENDADRSLPSLTTLAPLVALAERTGISFISLQKGAGEDEVASDIGRSLRLTSLGPQLQDFADTAAVISQLDLVISVDTAVAHLAGALGIPCWLLLPDHMPDWRWLKVRNDSPWYPGVLHLFRQKTRGQWDDIMNAVVKKLADEFFADHPPTA